MFSNAFAADVQRIPAAGALFSVQPGAQAQAVDDRVLGSQLPQLYFQCGHVRWGVVSGVGGGVQGEGGGWQAGGGEHGGQAVQQLAAQALIAAVQRQQLKRRPVHQLFAQALELGKLLGVQSLCSVGDGALDGKAPGGVAHGWASACWAR